MKTAVVHDWLTSYAGSERVLEQLLALYPDADLFTLVDFLPSSERHGIKISSGTSFLQHLPYARTRYRNYLPLMPLAIERFDLSAYDLIVSSSHAVAKGVRTRPGQLHICYCHTPMRYAWDLREQYLRETGLDRGLKGIAARAVLEWIRRWDLKTASRVDHFIANSQYIADRIRRAYGRDATVIYPPVNVDDFTLIEKRDDYFLAASRMVPYKKMDLIVKTFAALPGERLKVVGEGPDLEKIRSLAGANIEILGYQRGEVLRDLMQRAQAFVFAAEEDFGIIPVEAQACGTPVIAYGRGGATETVIPLERAEEGGATGVFFYEQTIDSLIGAVRKFKENRDRFVPRTVRKNAERFNPLRFRKELDAFIREKLLEHPQEQLIDKSSPRSFRSP